MATDVDLGSFMPEVAGILLGEPNKRLSTKTELRFGTNGSMAVDLVKGVFHDHEHGDKGGVLALIALKTGRHMNGAAGGAFDWLREHGFPVGDDLHSEPAAPRERARIVATYDYVDESGDLLFQVVRMEPKTFRQRRKATDADPPDKVRDGWVWSVKGIRQVPYRLPELLEALAMERTVFIAEGEKDVDNLAKLGLTATTNAMGAGKWPPELSTYFAGADVVILPDNDEAGRKHAEFVGAALQAAQARVRVLDLPNLPDKGDVSDWIAEGGNLDEIGRLVGTAAYPLGEAPAKLHFNAVWFADFDQGLQDPEWLVDDMLTRGDKSLVYGPSSSGKSFLATHIAMAVTQGTEVFGRRARVGGVVYIAAEGKKGFKKRLKAYRQEFAIEFGAKLPFLLIPTAIDLYAEDGDITALLADLRIVVTMMAAMGVTLELVVIDTLAAVSPGANENASEDMSLIIRHCDQIQEVTQAHVMIVHHKNAAGDRPRGHTSLYAACDNAIEVTCDEQKNRTAKVAKLKDGEDGETIAFKLQSVNIGSRDDGKSITSCVVVPAQAQAQTGKGPFLSGQQRIALAALHEALIDHGEPAPAGLKLPFGVKVVDYKYWRDIFAARAFNEQADPATIRQAMKRVGDALMNKRAIGRNSPYVWVLREPSA